MFRRKRRPLSTNEPTGSRASDRRGFPRVQAGYPVTLQTDATAPGAVYAGTLNISRGGMLVRLNVVLAEMSGCLVRFMLVGGRVKPDTTRGVIREVRRGDAANLARIEFETPLESFKLPVRPFSSPKQRPVKVLIVDDERPIRGLLTRFLERKGCAVETAEDGLAALRACRETYFDAILLDLYLPKLNGLGVLDRIRSEEIDVGAIYAISGQSDEEAAVESLRLGAHEFFPKPISLPHLSASLRLRLFGAQARRV